MTLPQPGPDVIANQLGTRDLLIIQLELRVNELEAENDRLQLYYAANEEDDEDDEDE